MDTTTLFKNQCTSGLDEKTKKYIEDTIRQCEDRGFWIGLCASPIVATAATAAARYMERKTEEKISRREFIIYASSSTVIFALPSSCIGLWISRDTVRSSLEKELFSKYPDKKEEIRNYIEQQIIHA